MGWLRNAVPQPCLASGADGLANAAINALGNVLFGVAEQCAGGARVNDLAGGLGANVAELEADPSKFARLVEARAQRQLS